ncbi:MAG TPA: bifunctional glutamate N-acetyltransferase/amino-acid acetyltransferase ArgJ [Longimicrobiales bacterium]|nr:bifunctional glutamate N-acetyltransferase/amino-acid acetyltransferase ArgJ [Longimicrobiales bacterium]
MSAQPMHDREATPRVEFHDPPRFPRGFSCAATNCGLKAEGDDLALFASEVPAAAAAVFTRNQVPGAPIIVGRELIRRGRLSGVVVNSKVSNVATGEEGIRNARRMGAAAAAALRVPAEEVLMSSTGVIGKQLPIERIEAAMEGLATRLQSDPLVGARAIMTTDTYPKALSCSVDQAVLTIVGKGAGMIAPNMATMLVYIFTDAAFDAPTLDRMLRAAVTDSFNMLSIDTDTSTSDTCAILANGLAGPVDESRFEAALRAACIRMAELIARDGEGATKLLRATVTGAATLRDARVIAKAIVESPLVKTMAYGADPNVGRVLMAVGKCTDCAVDAARITVRINGATVAEAGARTDFDEAALRAALAGDPVDIEVDLGLGPHRATAFGCDLTEGYIQENAAYYSS